MVEQYTFRGLLVWFICALFFVYEFMLRTILGTFQHPIMYDLKLSAIEFSLLSSTIYLLIYGLMQIPVGLVVDRIGLKKSVFFGCILCALSCFGFYFVDSYIMAACLRFITGFGSAFGFICLLVSVYEWLPSTKRAFLIGVSLFIGTMGPMIAAGPVETLAHSGSVNWRDTFLYLGVAGLVLSIFIILFVTNNSETTGKHAILKRPEPALKTIKHLFSRSQPILIAIFSALTYFTLEYLSENEGKIFLMAKGFGAVDASFMLTIAWLGYAIGCPVIGWYSDVTQKRKPSLIFLSVAVTFSLVGIVFGDGKIMHWIAFFMFGFGAAGSSISFAVMSEQFKKPYLAASLSLNNSGNTVFAAINAPAMGYIIGSLNTSSTVTLETYQIAFSGLIFVVSISMIISVFLFKETFCKSTVDFTFLSKK